MHADDHPARDNRQKIYRVSMPASIEAFVQRKLLGATRLEFCHTETHVVIRRGWEPIGDGCPVGAQDTVIPLEQLVNGGASNGQTRHEPPEPGRVVRSAASAPPSGDGPGVKFW